jgi:hypothetical protein
MRRDAWWLELLPVIALLGAFGVYATLRAFEGTFYEWGPYLPVSFKLLTTREQWYKLPRQTLLQRAVSPSHAQWSRALRSIH